MVKGGYRAFNQINCLTIELIRQFYDEPRFFRIVSPNGEQTFVSYDNSQITPKNQGSTFGIEMGMRKPIFDIKVSAQTATPFTKISQNELALQLYNAGFFNPEMKSQALNALSMMEFEGKNAIINKIAASVM